ncbi:uncharacterized protein (DUF58 family) [Dysgonomonas sp. PH5-45]|uniref:DUF58 domain-containing protein n=1 Tax=unclassified Dysgonomonas TaxID=2630389 RepID=UPI0024739CC1|nr:MULTISPECIES: DUF58 domain-containing protein [unclassified Dysgonomonas]MDH6354023.1 uncharacterized protein (DUF58 family) [Dysgonomonas sp. PH5-45]MDH6386925.1 uncharacterized protein (DUF58 family) [Dysgonomonas sp. PH5-37]
MPANRQDTSSPLIRFFRDLYLPNRFFIALAVCVVGFVVSYIVGRYFFTMQLLALVFFFIFLIDLVSLYRVKQGVLAKRICPERLSNGDKNPVAIEVTNRYPIPIGIEVVDEFPIQFQDRKTSFKKNILGRKKSVIFSYTLRPTKRGVYGFGRLNVYVSSGLGLVRRRYRFNQYANVAVYPSFIEMHRYELIAASHRLTEYGIKKIRRIGHASEFDHIKHYVMGDDPRTINYKASARTGQLMVNTYQEERSQQVYCILDKGRTMKMPFRGMTLLDYAINSSLMVCSTALNKSDKAGLITFSSKIDEMLPADRRQGQKNKILETLYGQQTNFRESDYERLYITLKNKITQRSLIVLYTNFETVNGMRRQLKYLSRLAKDHLVLVAFFLNSEFNEVLNTEPEDIEATFRKGMAEKLSYDKELIVKELNRYGIHALLTTPEELTINSINKYLEFKSRGLI